MIEQVNKDLLPIKGHYFLYNAATAPMVSFLPTIAKQLGFSGILVGSIYTILPISGLVAKPLFGALADKFKLHKTFFIAFQAVLAIAFFGINFIPDIETSAEVRLTCLSNDVFLEIALPSGVQAEISNSTTYATYCDVSCEASNEFYIELCHWNAVQYCALRNTTEKLTERVNFVAGLDVTTFEQLNNEALIRVRNATFFDNVPHLPLCLSKVTQTCVASCSNTLGLSRVLGASVKSLEESTYQFHVFLWLAIISWIGMAVVVSIGDAICIGLLGEENGKRYGKQKMWGSIGFGIFGISAGYIVDLASVGKSQKDYTFVFYLMLVAMAFDMLVSSTLKKTDQRGREPSVIWELLEVAKERRVMAFAWWCVGAGMCTGVVWNFLFWYTEELVAEDQRDWIKTLQGLLTGVQCFAGEMPFNFLSGAILRKLGHVNVMSLVLLVYSMRFMAYSLTSNVWLFLPLEILHGPSLGLCWPTMVAYGDKVSPSGTKATIQGLVGAVFEGIGVALGSFICGALMDSYGGVVTFRVFSAGALVWLGIHWLIQLLLMRSKSNPIHRGHNHLASYAAPEDAIYMTTSQELHTY